MRICRLGHVARTELFEQAQNLAAIVGQVIDPFEEALLQRRPKGLVKLADAAGVGIEFERIRIRTAARRCRPAVVASAAPRRRS
jgi:hypothetical protein